MFVCAVIWFALVFAVEPLLASHPLSGLYSGYRYTLTREYDREIPQRRENAELQILADGRFRFVALQRGKPGIWTRGTMRRSTLPKDFDWDFLCEDLHGTLRGRMVRESLDLVWQPDPLSVERFRFDPSAVMPEFETGHPAVLPPERLPPATSDTDPEIGPISLIWRGLLTAPGDLPKATGRTAPGAALMIQCGNDQLSGVCFLPAATPGHPYVLSPFSAELQFASDRRTGVLRWATPRPKTTYDRCLISGPSPEPGSAWSGETSFGGLVRSTFRFEPIGRPSPITAYQPPAASPRMYALVAALEQSEQDFPFAVSRLFPLAISFSDNRLWFRSPDDPQFQIAVPFEADDEGFLNVNADGRTGHLFRTSDRRVSALVIRSISSDQAGFRSRRLGPEHLWLALDLTVQTFGEPARTHRNRLVLFLRWSS